MRITLLNQFYAPDLAPTAHLASSLMEHRAAMGDDVRVVASRGGYVAPSGSDASGLATGVRVHRLWTPQFGKSSNLLRAIDYAFFYFMAMLRMLTMPRQDVVIAMTTPPMIGLAASLHKLLHPRTKIILWNMDCYPDVLEPVGMIRPGGWISRFFRWIVRMQFRSVDHLVTLDPAMTDLLVRQYVRPGHTLPATVIPNWEQASLFPADSSDPPRWKNAESLDLDGQFTLIYLGNTGYGHTFDTLLDAAELLRDEPVRFLFVGGGKRWDEIVAAKESRQLENVLMHPYIPKEETPSVMALADAALITLTDWSLGIMSPSKLHSNLAMGLPIVYVGPQGSNVDEAIAQQQCGISLRHGEAEQLAEFVRRCLSDPEHHATLRRQSRAAFDAHYCDLKTLPQFDAIIEQLTTR